MKGISRATYNRITSRTLYYFLVAVKAFKAQTIYRSQVISKILYSILLYLIQMYIWKSVNMSSAAEYVNIEYMSGYILLSSLISVFIAFDMNYIPIIELKVKNGTISEDLTKPNGFLLFHFFEYFGRCAFKLCFNVVPIVLFFVVTRQSAMIDLAFLAYYVPAVVGAMLIFFLINAICGMLSFWFVSVGNLHIIIDSSITLFSGSIIPLWLIPDKFKFVYEILPFKYLFYYPISILLGRLYKTQIYSVYAYQIVWCLVLAIISAIVYKNGIKKLQILG